MYIYVSQCKNIKRTPPPSAKSTLRLTLTAIQWRSPWNWKQTVPLGVSHRLRPWWNIRKERAANTSSIASLHPVCLKGSHSLPTPHPPPPTPTTMKLCLISLETDHGTNLSNLESNRSFLPEVVGTGVVRDNKDTAAQSAATQELAAPSSIPSGEHWVRIYIHTSSHCIFLLRNTGLYTGLSCTWNRLSWGLCQVMGFLLWMPATQTNKAGSCLSTFLWRICSHGWC